MGSNENCSSTQNARTNRPVRQVRLSGQNRSLTGPVAAQNQRRIPVRGKGLTVSIALGLGLTLTVLWLLSAPRAGLPVARAAGGQ